MPRRPLLTASALAAGAALVLTGCNGGDAKPEASHQAAGAPSASTGTPSAAPSSTVDRPRIPPFPADYVMSFEGRAPRNDIERAILSDSEQYLRAVDDAIVREDKNAKALSFYAKGQGLTIYTDLINKYIEGGDTMTGLMRYYNWKVSAVGEGSASVTFCADRSKAYAKNRKTGKAYVTPADKNSYSFNTARMEKNAEGVWQTSKLDTKTAAPQCQP